MLRLADVTALLALTQGFCLTPLTIRNRLPNGDRDSEVPVMGGGRQPPTPPRHIAEDLDEPHWSRAIRNSVICALPPPHHRLPLRLTQA